ncbi:MAG: asparagine--tRNA ligase [Desulfovibrio sp.]|nr:MAG: asparagine--tRNA ligase [Desulfovibrio sp.]
MPMRINSLLSSTAPARDVEIRGWVRTRRDAKDFSFLEINDGSCLANIQVIVDADSPAFEGLRDVATGAAVQAKGELVESPGKGQRWEIRATDLQLVGPADSETYPLQKKRHSDEFLRTIAHLRPRTNKYGALMRIRSEASFAVHDFFRKRGFVYVHTPIITGSDCEGAGEMFRVTTLDHAAPVDQAEPHAGDFFGKEANLTVSGQLEAEPLALALTDVYTFGPTFRAENSNTPRHAAEFWMIEPEMAFTDLIGNMDLAEAFIREVTIAVLESCANDLDLFARFVDKELPATWDMLTQKEFARMSYNEAINVLENSGKNFEFPVSWGIDLQTEHERHLCEEYCKRPLIVYDYPKTIKPFYMRVNNDGGERPTVAAMDVLAPRTGEIIGGSQREERMDVLEQRMDELDMDARPYWWYLDLRRFGSAPHSGFGMGFERFLMLLTGVSNIRDVIAFPRTPKHLEF